MYAQTEAGSADAYDRLLAGARTGAISRVGSRRQIKQFSRSSAWSRHPLATRLRFRPRLYPRRRPPRRHRLLPPETDSKWPPVRLRTPKYAESSMKANGSVSYGLWSAALPALHRVYRHGPGTLLHRRCLLGLDADSALCRPVRPNPSLVQSASRDISGGTMGRGGLNLEAFGNGCQRASARQHLPPHTLSRDPT